MQDESSVAKPAVAPDSDDDHYMDDFGAAPSPGGMSSGGGSRPGSPAVAMQTRSRASGESEDKSAASTGRGQDQTTLLQNENESFALAPVDASDIRGGTKRKRKLIVDEVKAISGEEMKAQLSDTQVELIRCDVLHINYICLTGTMYIFRIL